MSSAADRRQFLRLSAAFAGLGTAGPFAMQLAAMGSAAGQTVPNYKALVCIFLLGGNDSNNMVLATDSDSWGRYWSARNTGADPIALMPVGTAAVAPGQTSPVTGRVATAATPEAWGGVLPIVPNTPNPVPPGTNATTRTFALHPFFGPVQSLFNSGRLAIMANVGTLIQPTTKAQYVAKSVSLPVNLYSHNDQQSEWQTDAAEGARLGWGGRMADLMMSSNGTNSLFTAVSPAGNAVFLSGQSVVQYQITTAANPAVVISGANGSSLFGSTGAPAIVKTLLQDSASQANLMAADYATVDTRSIGAAGTINTALTSGAAGSMAAPPTFTNPITGATQTNGLAYQMQAIARMVAAAPGLGVQRQVFFASLGSFDTHQNENQSQPVLLAEVAQALSYFDTLLSNVGGVDRRSQVTAFTVSEFNRTFTTNGSGTDHAWGGHQLILGGAVRGKNIYGQFPTVGIDLGSFTNPNMSGNAIIPTASVDQYAATLGAWFGVGQSDMNTIFPNLANFSSNNLGFV
jgi:uncharacterized protein (DUF1501 family)